MPSRRPSRWGSAPATRSTSTWRPTRAGEQLTGGARASSPPGRRSSHQQGYRSGVYSSDASGIADLVSQYSTGYAEPDEIWIANWNGAQSTADANVPSSDWSAHQRLHQYQGAHNETYGGVTINIDGDYLDASTAAAGATAGTAAEWAASTPPSIAGQAVVGQTLNEGHGTWAGSPTGYAIQWEDCSITGAGCVAIAGATGASYTVAQSDLGHRIRVVETASNGAATSVPASSAVTASVLSPTPLYWLYTAFGNVYPSLGTAWYGSPSASRYRGSSVTGMAASADGRGYWVATTGGSVFAYGDARRLPAPRVRVPVKGIVSSPRGGYWLYSASGNVYPTRGTPWYGSPASRGFRSSRGSRVAGMAATPDGRGYWLVTNTGRMYAFGDARRVWVRYRGSSVAGIVAAPRGYWLYTAQGGVLASPGTTVYGSPAGSRYRGSSRRRDDGHERRQGLLARHERRHRLHLRRRDPAAHTQVEPPGQSASPAERPAHPRGELARPPAPPQGGRAGSGDRKRRQNGHMRGRWGGRSVQRRSLGGSRRGRARSLGPSQISGGPA